jgi:very-short-patch-repair endonuclease
VNRGTSAPTLTLPRKREGVQFDVGLSRSHYATPISSTRRNVTGSLSMRSSLPPLPLAGEGWGGGSLALGVAMDDQKRPSWKVPAMLRSNARALRKNSTDAERILWSELRDHRLNHAGFRRQVPIANYIADFVCHAARLVIELDGGQHFTDGQEAADDRRSAIIEAKGFRVLRFSNHDVLTNRAGVLETIASAIGASAPTLTLPRKRERESGAAGAMRETEPGVKRISPSDTPKQEPDARRVAPAQSAPSPACGGGPGWGKTPSDESNGS